MTVVSMTENKKAPAVAAAGAGPQMEERIASARAFLADYKKRTGLTWGRIAAELGQYAESSLNLFMSGKYGGSPEHIVAAIERFRDLDADRAANVIAPAYVETSIAQLIERALKQTKSRGRLGLISSDSGVGKSTAIDHYRRNVDPKALYVMASPLLVRRPFPLIARLLTLVGQTEKRGGDAYAYTQLVESLVSSRRLLIIDEAQFCSREVIDVLRCLHEESGTPIVFSGNESMHEFAFLSKASPAAFVQFTSRCSVEQHIRRTQITREDVILFSETVIPANVAEECSDVLLSQAHAPGGFRQLLNVLQSAHEIGRGKVTEAHIAKAIKSLPRRGGLL